MNCIYMCAIMPELLLCMYPICSSWHQFIHSPGVYGKDSYGNIYATLITTWNVCWFNVKSTSIWCIFDVELTPIRCQTDDVSMPIRWQTKAQFKVVLLASLGRRGLREGWQWGACKICTPRLMPPSLPHWLTHSVGVTHWLTYYSCFHPCFPPWKKER